MKSVAGPDQAFLFPGDKPGQPLTEIKKFWQRVCQIAEIEGVRLHDLRHAFASNLVSRGISLHIVGKLLGHTQPQTTARYAHLDDAALRDAANTFGAIIQSSADNLEDKVVPINSDS